MSIIAKKNENENNFEKIPAGTHNAVLYAAFDLGIQKTTYDGQEKLQHKVVLSWEVDKKITADGEYQGKRFVISKKYTLSLSGKANLRKDLESWYGHSFEKYESTGFDLEQLVGKPCMIGVVHTEKGDKTYANISAVMALPEGVQPLSPENGTEPPEWVKKLQGEAVNAQQAPIQQTGPIQATGSIEDEFAKINAENEGIDLHLE